MRTIVKCLLASAGISAGLWTLSAQPAAVTGSGFSDPRAFSVAPGLLATFFVTGIGAKLKTAQTAATIPLPFSLSGLSATYASGGMDPVPMPVFAVRPIESCPGLDQSGCGMQSVAVTVQIPFRILVNFPPTAVVGAINSGFGRVAFSENGVAAAAINVQAWPDRIHVVRTCDLAFNADPCLSYIPFFDGGPIVRHGDGSLVSAYRPASPGESLSIYTVGLGFVEGALDDSLLGKAPTLPVRLRTELQVSFSPEISGYAPSPANAATTGALLSKPDFVGLIPSAVGVYQINVTVPADLVVTGTCYATQGSAIHSNVKIRLTGSSSADEVGICAVANP